MSIPERSFKWLIFFIVLTFCFFGCHNESGKSLSGISRLMKLTSDYTEIVVYSAKVPGYWAKRASDGEKFFLYLYSLDGSYKKGDLLEVEGAFGMAPAVVFDDESRVYQNGQFTGQFTERVAVRIVLRV